MLRDANRKTLEIRTQQLPRVWREEMKYAPRVHFVISRQKPASTHSSLSAVIYGHFRIKTLRRFNELRLQHQWPVLKRDEWPIHGMACRRRQKECRFDRCNCECWAWQLRSVRAESPGKKIMKGQGWRPFA